MSEQLRQLTAFTRSPSARPALLGALGGLLVAVVLVFPGGLVQAFERFARPGKSSGKMEEKHEQRA